MASDDIDIFGGTYTVYQGSTKPITFTLTPAASVSGQTFEVRLVDQAGFYSTVTIAHASLTITTGTGVVAATLTYAITTALAHGLWDAELWRTNSGSEAKLKWITLEVKS